MSDERILDGAVLLDGRSIIEDVRLILRDGVIAAIRDAPPSPARRLILPALINAHDHARPTASAFGALNMPLETWILLSVLGTPPNAYLAAATSLARSARSGCAAMMVHYTRPSGLLPIVDEARAIARATHDVGIRLAFALAVRDQNPLVYGDASPFLARLEPEQVAAVEAMFVRAPPTPASYIDLARLDPDPIMPTDPLDMVFARANKNHIEEVIVAGRTIVHDGTPSGIDLPAAETELRQMYRAQMPAYRGLLAAWGPLSRETTSWYRANCGCG